MAGDVTQERQQAHASREGEHAMNEARQHAHELIDRMPETQLSALVGLLETIVDPPLEDEEISEEEEAAVARSKEWFKQNDGIPFEQVVADLGFTMDQVRSASKDPAA
jgi:hypothetical protein